MQHYFILNAQHEPVEVDLGTFCAFDKNIADTAVAENTRVWTVFLGMTVDHDPPAQPYFVHYVYEPGWQYRTVDTYGYHEAVARHGRIVEWLTKRAERRRQRAAAVSAS
ncbi:hypothetical protein [Burkholderia vietnamiensis]|uniref:hypothetical protein n=1 Tax=Burkholderia vietnamiensis TaxID=60552 RepID=UPI001CF45533|nr:hypothetical protein [Burkholderia vietnamiensis]MCA8264781.1 hypothetical protein [Burkholderia vietnamiensis]HDR8929690.1 hypothetical protein [Burkholderia vietnamiensis]